MTPNSAPPIPHAASSPSVTPRPPASLNPPTAPRPPTATSAARPSRLLSGIYHDIGMAAVATGLELAAESLDAEAHEAVKRGNRYIYLMPKRPDQAL